MDYFEHSQRVKKELEGNQDILDNTRIAFMLKKVEGHPNLIDSGGTVNLFRVGRLESGLYVALRAFGSGTLAEKEFGPQKIAMRRYMQNVEWLSSKGEGVPNFCVGVNYNNERAGILTEDLTAGGTLDLEHDEEKPYGFVKMNDGSRRQVYVDVDGQFRCASLEERNHFDEDLCIKL